jgi:hypothetical protein
LVASQIRAPGQTRPRLQASFLARTGLASVSHTYFQ